ncbi:hypothetical protein Ancab_039660 [Ancistrocladus abbreviatus]
MIRSRTQTQGSTIEMQHFSHDHPLCELPRIANYCAACGSEINGPAFGCKRCGFYLHKHCAELPPKLRHPRHQNDPLKLQFSRGYRGRWSFYTCGICHGLIDGTSSIYACNGVCACDDCNGFFMAHIDCALLKPSLKHSYHKHPLVFVKQESLIVDKCAACGLRIEYEFGGTDVYFCQECGDIFHHKCLNMPARVACPDLHPCDLTLYVDPIPENHYENHYYGDYYCDACHEIRDIHMFSYACKKCDFICHTRCDILCNSQVCLIHHTFLPCIGGLN